jgi:adenylate cyclase
MPSDGFAAVSRTLALPVAGDEDRRPPMIASLLGALAVLAIGVLDAVTGELRLSVLYVIVIMLMTWRNGRANGLMFAAASGLALVVANTAGGGRPISDPLFLVSAASDLLVFGFCAVGTNALREGLFRERLRQRNLARYLPAPFAEQLANEGLGAVKSRSCAATIMFIDIRGFTALARTLAPAEVFALLQSYRRIVASAVRTYGGFIDKFVGDGALAVFGIAEGPEDSAGCAVTAALEIVARVDEWGRRQRAAGRPALKIGIGLHHGEVLVGAIGDDERLEFTVLGNTVNVAARIEDLTRELELPLLVSEDVHAALPPDIRNARTWSRLSVPGVRGLAGPLGLAYPD